MPQRIIDRQLHFVMFWQIQFCYEINHFRMTNNKQFMFATSYILPISPESSNELFSKTVENAKIILIINK